MILTLFQTRSQGPLNLSLAVHTQGTQNVRMLIGVLTLLSWWDVLQVKVPRWPVGLDMQFKHYWLFFKKVFNKKIFKKQNMIANIQKQNLCNKACLHSHRSSFPSLWTNLLAIYVYIYVYMYICTHTIKHHYHTWLAS